MDNETTEQYANIVVSSGKAYLRVPANFSEDDADKLVQQIGLFITSVEAVDVVTLAHEIEAMRIKADVTETEMDNNQQEIIDAIVAERDRQDALWGITDHDPLHWHLFLSEELGEVSRAIQDGTIEDYRVELIQLAALCVNALECAKRQLQPAE